MEQKMRFGLILGRLAILKKKLGQLWLTFEASFFMFSWAKNNVNFLKKHCSVCTKKLHNFSFIKKVLILFWFFLAKNMLNIRNQLCIALLDTPPCATSMYWLWLWKLKTPQAVFPYSLGTPLLPLGSPSFFSKPPSFWGHFFFFIFVEQHLQYNHI